MRRIFAYSGEIPPSADILNTNRNLLKAMGLLMQDTIGNATNVSGLACGPTTPASLSVAISPGRIYSLQTTDSTAYSDIGTDSDQIIKQGILAAAVNLSCPAPVTTGQSINYLIEAQYQDSDTATAVLPYYNAANPASPLSGVGGLGAPQATQRDGIISLVAKAGLSATTGSQVTPSPDSGYIGLWVVTVAFGATTILSGNIVQAASAPFLSATIASLAGSINLTFADGRYLQLVQQTAAEIAAGVTIANLAQPELSVLRYGINTTPGTTDMLPAFNAAAKVATQYGGGIITVPGGAQGTNYFLSAQFSLPKSTALQGSGPHASFLSWNHTGNGVVSLSPINSSTEVSRQLRGVSLANANGSNTGAAFVDVGGTAVQLINVRTSGFKYGVMADQSELMDLEYCDIEGASNTTAGFWRVNGADHTPGVTFTAAPAINATSGTLTGNFTGPTGTYNLNFVETVGGASEPHTATLTNGSTAVSWVGGLSAACNAATTAAATGFSNRISLKSCQLNNAPGVGFAIIDDGGNGLSLEDLNVDGWNKSMRSCGAVNLQIMGGLWSACAANNIDWVTTSSVLGTATTKSFGISVNGTQFGPATGQAVWNVVTQLGDIELSGNCFFSTTVTPLTGMANCSSFTSVDSIYATPTAGMIDAFPQSYFITGREAITAADQITLTASNRVTQQVGQQRIVAATQATGPGGSTLAQNFAFPYLPGRVYQITRGGYDATGTVYAHRQSNWVETATGTFVEQATRTMDIVGGAGVFAVDTVTRSGANLVVTVEVTKAATSFTNYYQCIALT